MSEVKEPERSEATADDLEVPTPAAAAEADLAVSPELAAGSLGEYLRAAIARVRGGDSGVLPVVGGLLLISILFQSLNSHFLTAGNLVNLLIQGAVYMLLAMGEVFALLLGEIDLSIGFVSGIGGIVTAELVKQSYGWPWWAAIIVALLVCAAIGALQGTIITRVGLPSFVVTLAGLLGWQGVMLLMLGKGGSLPINVNVINDFASGNLTPTASWIVMVAIGLLLLFLLRHLLVQVILVLIGVVGLIVGLLFIVIGLGLILGGRAIRRGFNWRLSVGAHSPEI